MFRELLQAYYTYTLYFFSYQDGLKSSRSTDLIEKMYIRLPNAFTKAFLILP